MPRGTGLAAGDVLERGLLALAGAALALVALSGALVVGVSRRALSEAGA